MSLDELEALFAATPAYDIGGKHAADLVRIVAWCRSEGIAAARERDRLREALQALVVAVTYADPPELFNGILCHEARVPVEFVHAARAVLPSKHEPQP